MKVTAASRRLARLRFTLMGRGIRDTAFILMAPAMTCGIFLTAYTVNMVIILTFGSLTPARNTLLRYGILYFTFFPVTAAIGQRILLT